MDNEVRGVPEFQPKPINNGNLEYQVHPQVQVQVNSPAPGAPNGRDSEFERERVIDADFGSDVVVCLFVDPSQPGIKFNDATPSDKKIPGQDIPEDGKFEAEVSSLAVAEWDETINSNNGDFSVRFDSAGKKIITIMVTEERMLAIIDKLSKEVFSERVVIETGLKVVKSNNINEDKEIYNDFKYEYMNKPLEDITNSVDQVLNVEEVNKNDEFSKLSLDEYRNEPLPFVEEIIKPVNHALNVEEVNKNDEFSKLSLDEYRNELLPFVEEIIKPATPHSSVEGFNNSSIPEFIDKKDAVSTIPPEEYNSKQDFPSVSDDNKNEAAYREFLEIYNDYKRIHIPGANNKKNGNGGSSSGFGKKG